MSLLRHADHQAAVQSGDPHDLEKARTGEASRYATKLTVVLVGGPAAAAATTKAHSGGALPEFAASALALLQPTNLCRVSWEIATMAARGLSSKPIAARPVVSVHTVDDTLRQVYNKLAVKAGRTSARLLVPAIAPFPSRVKPRTWPETRVADYSGAYAPHAHRLDLAFIQNAPELASGKTTSNWTTLTGRTDMSNELNISKVLSGLELPPNTPGEWFIPRGNVTGNKVSFYNAVPTSIRDTDQQVEIYEVFTLRKGADHGPAAGELQTRLRIRNLSLSEAVVFDVYQAETDN